MQFNKKNLIALIQGKGDCKNVMCDNTDCNKCQLHLLPYSHCYKLAIDIFIKRYGEEKLFEELL